MVSKTEITFNMFDSDEIGAAINKINDPVQELFKIYLKYKEVPDSTTIEMVIDKLTPDLDFGEQLDIGYKISFPALVAMNFVSNDQALIDAIGKIYLDYLHDDLYNKAIRINKIVVKKSEPTEPVVSGTASPVEVSAENTDTSGTASPVEVSAENTDTSGTASPVEVSAENTDTSGTASPVEVSAENTDTSGTASPVEVSAETESVKSTESPSTETVQNGGRRKSRKSTKSKSSTKKRKLLKKLMDLLK